MRVKWKEYRSPTQLEMEMFPNADWSECDEEYEGDVISTVKSFLEGTQFVVACTDKKIREVSVSKCQIL